MAQKTVISPTTAFYGAKQSDIAAEGWKLVGTGPGAYYAKTVDDPNMSNLPGGTGSSAPGSTPPAPSTPTTKTPVANMDLPPQNTPMDSYTWSTGGSAAPGGGAPPSTSPGGGAPPGGSNSLSALRSAAGVGGSGGGSGSLSGLGAAAGVSGLGDVGALNLGSVPNPQAAPVAPTAASDAPPDPPSGQALMAPGAMRQGLGQRVPPSLAALLQPKVY